MMIALEQRCSVMEGLEYLNVPSSLGQEEG
jgi:hypothetical protein